MTKILLMTSWLILTGLTLPEWGLARDEGCEQCLGGSPNAPIRIEVFSDFQCPACRTLYLDTMKLVLKDYCNAEKVCVIYREFPLAMHSYARDAARYSLAAQKLGKQQWLAVVDSLYTDQGVWSQSGNVQASVARSLPPADFQKVLSLAQEPSVIEAIERDIALGQKREVKSTPTFFLNYIGHEQKVVGGLPYVTLKQFFDQIVK